MLAEARIPQKAPLARSVFAGPAAGILVSAREIVTEDGTGVYNESVKDWYKSVDFGAAFGVGAEIPVSNLRIVADLRYYLGLAQATDYPEHTLKNMALIFTLGAAF